MHRHYIDITLFHPWYHYHHPLFANKDTPRIREVKSFLLYSHNYLVAGPRCKPKLMWPQTPFFLNIPCCQLVMEVHNRKDEVDDSFLFLDSIYYCWIDLWSLELLLHWVHLQTWHWSPHSPDSSFYILLILAPNHTPS